MVVTDQCEVLFVSRNSNFPPQVMDLEAYVHVNCNDVG